MDPQARSTDATEALGSAYCPIGHDALLAAHKSGSDTSTRAVKLPLELESIEVKGESFSFVSTTGSIDRYHDIIRPRGLDVSSWNKNSIILFSHDVRQRIGVGETRLTSRADKWITTAEYFTEEISPLAVSLRRMIDFRIDRARRLKTEDQGGAFSIGFIPQKLSFIPERNGFDIEKAEKLEDSDVSLASNTDALIAREAFSDGVKGLGGLFDWAEHVRKEIGIVGINHEVGQRLIELVDPAKGLTLIQITPEHLKRLRLDPPVEAEPAPIEATLEETSDPVEIAIRCREAGLGDELTQQLLVMKFPAALAEIEAKETPVAPAAPEPAAEPSDEELARSVERALAGDSVKNLLIQQRAATGHLN